MTSDTTPGRRRAAVVLAVIAGVALVGAALVLVTRSGQPPDAVSPTTPGTTAVPDGHGSPSPTPTQPPGDGPGPGPGAERPLGELVVAAAGPFVSSDLARSDEPIAPGAVDGYTGSFSNGRDVVRLRSGGWPSPDEAAAVAAATPDGFAAEDLAETGDVGDPPVGTYRYYERDGDAALRWSNGDLVLELLGAPEAVRSLYLAYPL